MNIRTIAYSAPAFLGVPRVMAVSLPCEPWMNPTTRAPKPPNISLASTVRRPPPATAAFAALVLPILADGEMTAAEIAARLGSSAESTGSRLSALVNAGFITRQITDRRAASGRLINLYRVSQ